MKFRKNRRENRKQEQLSHDSNIVQGVADLENISDEIKSQNVCFYTENEVD